jgi:hypothetical protein
MRGIPLVIAHDAEVRYVNLNPLALWTAMGFALPPRVRLATLVPYTASTVEIAVQDCSHSRWRPGAGVPLARTRRRKSIGVQSFGYALHSVAGRAHLKDSSHDGGLRLVDFSIDMGASSVRALHFHVAIPITVPTARVPAGSVPCHRVCHPLSRFLAFGLGCKVDCGHDELVGGRLQLNFSVLESYAWRTRIRHGATPASAVG